MRWFSHPCLPFVLAALFVAASTGCNAFQKNATPPWKKKPDPLVANVITSKMRIEKMREVAKKASTLSPTDQEKETFELSQVLRKGEDDPLVRAEILRTLAVFQTATATAALNAGSADSDQHVRIACCQAWGKRGGPDAVRKLSEIMSSDTDIDVRLAAARELGKLGDPAAVQALGTGLDSKDPAMQHRAVESLRQVTKKDFGNNVNTWRDFVRGGQPPEESFASRWLPWR
jgi:HEAT repeat protein